MLYTNPVKEKIAAGGVVIGPFIQFPSPEIIEVVALAGFDFAFLDAEHGRISPEDAYPMILAAEANGIPALARVGQNDRQVILKFLDLGISGVMIPQTNTEASARDAVQAMRYHPRGIRGLAGGRSFGYGMGGPAFELVPQINDRVLSIIQFEHIDALAELDALDGDPRPRHPLRRTQTIWPSQWAIPANPATPRWRRSSPRSASARAVAFPSGPWPATPTRSTSGSSRASR